MKSTQNHIESWVQAMMLMAPVLMSNESAKLENEAQALPFGELQHDGRWESLGRTYSSEKNCNSERGLLGTLAVYN